MTPLQQKTVKAIVNVFETGRAAGNYSAVTVIPGDKGHLTYGRSQSALGSGSLFELISQYCAAPGAKYAAQLQPYLPRLQSRDATLDNDQNLRAILKDAGSDPVMQAEQDRFFDTNYFTPACTSATGCGLSAALSQAVVYDSWVQGHWQPLRDATNAKCGGAAGSNGVTEQQWVQTYVDNRKAWLAAAAAPLPNTAYRMESFVELITGGKWDLPLPVTVHGVTITEADLNGAAAHPALRLTNPPTTGDDVRTLQAALAAAGFPCGNDGAFGPAVENAVRAFQSSKGMQPDGVAGPETWAGLG